MKNSTQNQNNSCRIGSGERWTLKPLAKLTLCLGSVAEGVPAERSLSRAYFCSSPTLSPPWISRRRWMKLGSRSLPLSSIPSLSSSRSMVHDTFIGERHLQAFSLGTLYHSSTNYNTVPTRRGPSLNRQTSSTANLTDNFTFCSVYPYTRFCPYPFYILHPPEAGLPHMPFLFNCVGV